MADKKSRTDQDQLGLAKIVGGSDERLPDYEHHIAALESLLDEKAAAADEMHKAVAPEPSPPKPA
jgi:hypothetical protein